MPAPNDSDTKKHWRILLVEDNPVDQMVARAMLDELGYRVEVVENCAQVIAVFEAAACDMIFMDGRIPHMDGYAATRRIRQLESARGNVAGRESASPRRVQRPTHYSTGS